MYRSRTLCFLASLLTVTTVNLVAPVSVAQASEPDPTVTACLEAFGEHPFGANPEVRTLPIAVRVFGIGKATVDDKITSSPALIYIKQGVNVMGGTVIDLRNPQGWYCMRSVVNVMGGLTVKLACDSQFAVVGEGASVMSSSDGQSGTTVMGKTTVERVC